MIETPKTFREKVLTLVQIVLRPRNLYVLLAFAFVSGLLVLKGSWVSDYARRSIDFVQTQNERVVNLFQATFSFNYEDQFKPGIEEILKKNRNLRRIRLISNSGQVVFDSRDLAVGKTVSHPVEARLAVRPGEPILFDDPQGIGILAPIGQYTIYYVFSLTALNQKIATILVGGLALLGFFVLFRSFFSVSLQERASTYIRSHVRLYSIRSKFIFTIVGLNLITCAIVFVSLSYVQKREQTERIMKDSIVYAWSSADNIIADYNNYFYFFYKTKFIPAIRHLLSTNENLTEVRIISRKTNTVVFDSQNMSTEAKISDLTDEVSGKLLSSDEYHEMYKGKDGAEYFKVIQVYRNENQDVPFLVEFIFSFSRLNASVAAVRHQLLLDLAPSLALGILVAILFSQLLLGPVKKMVKATQSITAGNYEVDLYSFKKDELGDLMRSFNGMAIELKRKSELRKYLSDQSYRRLVEGPESGARGGSRVRATVLFCDIRNFVSVCESMDAEDVTSMLNEYFSNMVEVIYKHRGEVDKFIGDAILAVFYEPTDVRPGSNMALHAIYCAMEMRDRLQEFNAKRVKSGKPVIDIGIGINSGEIISGPIGSPDRMDFTVIGDVVNLASRIEKLSKQGRHTRIVFSNFIEERVRGLLEYEELSHEKIRGKEEDIIAYELIRVRDVRELLDNLNNPDPAIKKHSIELLGYSSNTKALPALYQKLSDSSEIVRVAAVSAITRLAPPNHKESLDVLFQQLENERAVKVISVLLISLGRLCHDERLLEIAPFLRHGDERIVANTIEALSGSDDPEMMDLLIPFLASKSNRIKANAAMVLFSKGKVEVLEALTPMLMHSDRAMRASAAFALGELTQIAAADNLASRIRKTPASVKQFLGELQSTVPLLVSLLKDSDPNVKRQAIIALGKIKDKSAVLPLLENMNLEKDSKELMQEVAEALRSIGSHRLVREMVRNIV